MKKSSVFFVSLLISVFFLSCNSKPLPSILGTWEANLTLKSELRGGGESSDAPVALLYTKQHVSLAFSEGGVYTQKVLQTVDSVEFPGHEDEVATAKEYYEQFFNKNLTFDGEYEQTKNTLSFTVETVQGEGELPLSYLEFFEKDPSIGDAEIVHDYEMKDGVLVVDGIKYTKAE